MVSRVAGLFVAVGLSVSPFGVTAAGASPPAKASAPDSGRARAAAESTAAAHPLVLRVSWSDAITPVTRKFLSDAIEAAKNEHAEVLLVQLDTPGGLLDATRNIVSDFFASPVPIIVWVAPAGARAASAGAFLTMAAHVAAMAPGTNLGAASPIQIGGAEPDSGSTLSRKMFQDTAAFARTIAERRGRSVDWAERAVQEAKSSTEREALEGHVIDFTASTVDEVLAKANGLRVMLPWGEHVLALADARVVERPLGLRFRLLSYLANPNVATVLMMLGVWGLFFELQNPGSIFPGIVGALCLILGFYSLQTFPLNFAGALLLALGAVLFLVETQVPSHGLLAVGGVVSTVLGAMMLFESPEPALRASLSVILPLALVSGLFFMVVAGLSVRTMRTKPTTGREGMLGLKGVAATDLDPKGTVDVRGERWNAVCDVRVAAGETVEVTAVDGLLLKVRKVLA